jgi:oligopeptide transport system permease protein
VTRAARLLSRACELALAMLVIITLSFAIIRLAPGSPFADEKSVAPGVIAELEARYGLDRPLLAQLGRYLTGLAHADLGPSLHYPGRSVGSLIAEAAPVTLLLAALALAWALLVGVAAGLTAALKPASWIDRLAMTTAVVGISVPSFVLGPLLVLLVALTLYWLPPAGFGTWRHLLLPSLTLGMAYAGQIARLTRTGFLEVARQPYIIAARAKGLPEWRIVCRHMLPGGLQPLITYLGPVAAHLAVGSVVVEKLFAIPGLGPYLVDAAFNRDYFLMMGIVIMESAVLLGANALVDLAYTALDPRQRKPCT